MTQGAAHWLCHEGISAARRRVVHKGRPASIDATKVARESGMGGRINTIMQVCFFALAGRSFPELG